MKRYRMDEPGGGRYQQLTAGTDTAALSRQTEVSRENIYKGNTSNNICFKGKHSTVSKTGQ